MKADLVLEGGGVKGIGLVGAVARLEREFDFARVAGTSVGALVGSLVAAGFTGGDLEDELFDFPFDEVTHPDLLDRVPVVGPLASIAFERGVWETTRVRDHLAKVLEKRDVSTFGDLRRRDAGSSLPIERRYRLVVTATEVTAGELLYLPWDYRDRFDVDPDTQLVADAVAASIAIPFFFVPRTLVDRRTDTEHVLVDGGLLSNYPISVFDRTDRTPPRWPTFGLKIVPRLPEGIQELVPFAGRIPLRGMRHVEAVLATAVVGRDQTYLSRPDVRARTIEIDTSGVGVVEFGLSHVQKHHLRDHGWQAAERFLDTWNWERYLLEHRGIRSRPPVDTCRVPPGSGP